MESLVVTLTIDALAEIIRNTIKEEVPKLLPPKVDKLYTRKEACKRLRCSLPTLDGYRDAGYITETREGKRKVFYKESAIESALISIKRYQTNN